MRTLLIALTFVHAMAVPCLAETFQKRIGLCLTCHGENGQSDNVEVPSLGAEPAPFVLIQLYLFREKQRRVEPMTDAAKDLTDDDLRQFGFPLFAKVVRQYGCSLPRSAWHDEDNCTRSISAARSVARPDQCEGHRQLIGRVATKDCVTSGSGRLC